MKIEDCIHALVLIQAYLSGNHYDGVHANRAHALIAELTTELEILECEITTIGLSVGRYNSGDAESVKVPRKPIKVTKLTLTKEELRRARQQAYEHFKHLFVWRDKSKEAEK